MDSRILVPLDGGAESERIIPWVRRLARHTGGTVRLLTVRPAATGAVVKGEPVIFADQLEDQVRAETLSYLKRVAAWLSADDIPVEIEVRFGDPVEMILASAGEWGATLIAMVTRAHGGLGALLGRTVATQIVRRASVHVLVARSRGQRVA